MTTFKEIYDLYMDGVTPLSDILEMYKKLKNPCISALNNIASLNRTLGNYSEAEKTYRQILLTYPNDILISTVYFNYGNLLVKMKKFDRAMDMYNMTIRIKPDYINALINIGWIYHSKKCFRKAAYYYRMAYSNKPEGKTLASLHENMGLLLHERSFHNISPKKESLIKKAKTHYTATLLFNPNIEISRKALEYLMNENENDFRILIDNIFS